MYITSALVSQKRAHSSHLTWSAILELPVPALYLRSDFVPGSLLISSTSSPWVDTSYSHSTPQQFMAYEYKRERVVRMDDGRRQTGMSASWVFLGPPLDHGSAGIGAATVSVLCKNPLDLLKVKFQVSTCGPKGGIGREIWRALRDVHASEDLRVNCIMVCVAGGASSWDFAFSFVSPSAFSLFTTPPYLDLQICDYQASLTSHLFLFSQHSPESRLRLCSLDAS
ncbi:hypothetical protein EDB87DRAFT_1684420 [Lactarius vividus]|nr:hypothetical protein EDB87DRAFT_1684420 [Lactarius vividus]